MVNHYSGGVGVMHAFYINDYNNVKFKTICFIS